MVQTMQEIDKTKILRAVPFDRGFHFTNQNGTYLGITAVSLSDFAEKLETIDANSIVFHYPRGDFQKWVNDTLGDEVLADRMCFIKKGIVAEQLRKQLWNMVQRRINELESTMQPQTM